MTNNSTLAALKSELEKLLNFAQSALEQYVTASRNPDDWQQTVDAFQQLRGTFAMLEHEGARLLCEEAVHVLQHLPVQSPQQQTAEIEALTTALVVLGKYLEFQEFGRAPYPEILLPAINRLRKARGGSPLREGCFHRFEFVLDKQDGPTVLTPESLQALKKFRHMYQAGFLQVIRGAHSRRILDYLAGSLRRIHRALAVTPYGEYWHLAAMAAEGLATSEAEQLLSTRRRWLAQQDKQLRAVLQAPEQALNAPPHKALVQEALYYIALTAENLPHLQAFQQDYPKVQLSHTDRQLQEQIQLMRGPGRSVLDSVAAALKEEFNQIRVAVDLAASGDDQFSAFALRDMLLRAADSLEMAGLTSPGNLMRRMWELVRQWPDNAAPQTGQLMPIADAVLYAESALIRLVQSGQRFTAEDGQEGARQACLQLARVAVLDEMEAGVSVCKRAVTAFMDSQHDVLHVTSTPATLNSIRGALIFLDAPDAVAIVEHCMHFMHYLCRMPDSVTNAQLEAFADALSSLEFYFEGLLSGQHNADVIRLARSSLAELPQHLSWQA